MKGDFSRFTFDPLKHYSSVRMQQGRLQLDADWNEQIDITAHRIETEIKDFLGSSGTPEHNAGFQIAVIDVKDVKDDPLTIGRGRYYVAGMLFENEAIVPCTRQPDYPGALLPTDPGIYLAYLDTWQRHISALEDPDIVEPALGGADTATRLKNVWQVKLRRLGEPGIQVESTAYAPPWQPDWELPISTGKMSAQVSTIGMVQENQLYRVEIHTGGKADETTIKWSCDNGSVAARVSKLVGNTITVSSAGRVAQASFARNQWVELTNEARTLQKRPGILVELSEVQGDELTVANWPDDVNGIDLWHTPWPGDRAAPQQITVRRWDSPGAVKITQSEPILLDNIQVKFATGGEVVYKTGDYWLIPARQLTGNIEWHCDDKGNTLPQPPHGVLHHYCALALLQLKDNQWSVIHDLRIIFKPLATGLVSKGGDTITGDLSIAGSLRARDVYEDGIALQSKYEPRRPYYPLNQPQILALERAGSGYDCIGGFTDGRFAYLVPNASNVLVRVDTQNFDSASVSASVEPLPIGPGFFGGFTDGRYGYFVPNGHGTCVRVDLQRFAPDGVARLDLSIGGFEGGFTDGRYGYFVPFSHGTCVRVDLQRFAPDGVARLDLTTINPALRGFSGGFTAGPFAYLVPFSHGTCVRLDLQRFDRDGVTTLDLTTINPALQYFTSGFSDGRFGYLVPGGRPDLTLGRIDLQHFDHDNIASLALTRAC